MAPAPAPVSVPPGSSGVAVLCVQDSGGQQLPGQQAPGRGPQASLSPVSLRTAGAIGAEALRDRADTEGFGNHLPESVPPSPPEP